MNTENKKILQETSRWLRVSFLTVTVLGPVINTLSSLLRGRAATLRDEATKRGTIAYTQSQELAKRGEHVSKVIMKQSAKVSSKEVSKRSRKAAKDMRKRTLRAQRQLAKRTKQLTQQNMRQSTPLWAVSSFSIGLIAAGIAAYLLVKKRLQQQESQQEHFSQNGYLRGTAASITRSEAYSNSQPTFKTTEPANGATSIQTRVEPIVEPLTVEPELDEYEAETEKMPTFSLSGIVKGLPTVEEPSVLRAETPEQQAATITDAAFLGVVGTQHYYPIETPLNELQAAENDTLDVIYFATEDDAKAQGYTSAS